MSSVRVDAEKLVIPVKELPALPAVHARVLQLATDESTTIEQLEDVIRVDQSLTTKVLRIANSAAYGFKRKFETITDAVVALGMRKLRGVASAASLAGLFQDSGMVEGKRLWAHSLAVALWSERLAPSRDAPAFLFTAGLMHDLGIVVLDQFASESYHKILAVTRKGGFRLQAVEERFLGTTHAEVGKALCNSWKLPDELAYTIGAQYDLEPAQHVLKIRLADLIANEEGYPNFAWTPTRPIEDELLTSIEITRDDLEALRERFSKQVQSEVMELHEL